MENWFEIFFNWFWAFFFGITVGPLKTTEQKKTPPYEYKYLDAFDALKNGEKETPDSNDEANYNNNSVMDNTPYGNVVMNYNKDEEMFMYYCDKREIPYKYLESVARKFVINNKCAHIYVDIRDELRPKKMEVEVIELKPGEKEDGVKNDKMKGVFATFKKKTGKKSVKQNTDTQKKVVFKECLNKYKWCGRLSDFSFLESSHVMYAHSKHVCADVKEISFADFKNM